MLESGAGKPIRRRVLIPLSLTFAVLLIAFVHIAYQIRAGQNLLDMRHRYQVTQSYTNETFSQRQSLVRQLLLDISRDHRLARAMAANDRAALLSLSRPILDQLMENYGVNHFYFHTPAGTSFLRVYDPEEYGDKIERGTFLAAAHSQKFSFGLELGKSGTLTYRGVLPWRVAGKLLGYIEIGIELDQVLAQLQQIVKEEFLVMLDKGNLEREQWQRGREQFGRAQNWDLLPDRVIAYQTLADFSVFEKRRLPAKIFTLDDEYIELVINQRDYRAKGFPLFDFNDRAIGTILVLHDITLENRRFMGLVTPTMLVSSGFCLALFLFAYTVLGRMDRQLAATRQQLSDEVDNVRNSNKQLEAEIRQRCEAEQALQQLNETLEARVVKRTAALEELNRQLKNKQAKILHQDKMACIGQVAAGLAHDINNPVGFVSHNLTIFERYLQRIELFVSLQEELIRARADADLRAGWEKGRRDFKIDEIFQELPVMLGECRDGTTRITQIVQGLRTFSRVDTQRYQLTDLHQCLDSTLALLRHELADKIKVVRDYGEIPHCYCYPEQINQVFMNLLINAIQAIGAPGEIRLRSRAEHNLIFVTISDNGCGIPAELLAKVFEPFYTTKPVGVGTGLGLSIVYDIISRHRGEIKVISEAGVGTSFTMQLPCDGRTNPAEDDDTTGPAELVPPAATGDQDV